jgi:hypothetical protein
METPVLPRTQTALSHAEHCSNSVSSDHEGYEAKLPIASIYCVFIAIKNKRKKENKKKHTFHSTKFLHHK